VVQHVFAAKVFGLSFVLHENDKRISETKSLATTVGPSRARLQNNLMALEHYRPDGEQFFAMRRAMNIAILLVVAFTATGCADGPREDRWCYFHPHRCP